MIQSQADFGRPWLSTHYTSIKFLLRDCEALQVCLLWVQKAHQVSLVCPAVATQVRQGLGALQALPFLDQEVS